MTRTVRASVLATLRPRLLVPVDRQPSRLLLSAEAADASQAATQSQAPTQSSKGAVANAKYLLVNKLQGAISLPPSDASLVYLGFVETMLQLIARNQGGPRP